MLSDECIQQVFVFSILDIPEDLAEFGVELCELSFAQFNRNDKVDKVVRHISPKFFIWKLDHLVERLRAIPRARSCIDDEGDDGIEMICEGKSGEIFVWMFEVFECEMFFLFLTDACKQCQGIINHVSERHGIVYG